LRGNVERGSEEEAEQQRRLALGRLLGEQQRRPAADRRLLGEQQTATSNTVAR